MTAEEQRTCFVCGSLRQLEQNHVGARANDRVVLRDLCERCHREFTDWQWRLGILRRETRAERQQSHDDLERGWALVEGFVLLALAGGRVDDADLAVLLGRATGTVAAATADASGPARRWGPKPAKRRGRSDAVPVRRGAAGAVGIIGLGVEVASRLDPSDTALQELLRVLPVALRWLPTLEAMPEIAGVLTPAEQVTGTADALRAAAQRSSVTDFEGDELAFAALARNASATLAILTALTDADTPEAARDAVLRVLDA